MIGNMGAKMYNKRPTGFTRKIISNQCSTFAYIIPASLLPENGDTRCEILIEYKDKVTKYNLKFYKG